MNLAVESWPLALLLMAVKGGIVIGAVLNLVPICIYLERKICAFIQGRVGPNRVGPLGLLQPVADAVKLMFKEEIIPRDADRVLYLMAPLLTFLFPAAALAFIPFGPVIDTGGSLGPVDLRVCPVDTGLLMLLAVTSLGVYGIAFGGWASNSKYPLMGAIRASSQMISYAVAAELALVAIIATSGSVNLQEIVLEQTRPLQLFGLEVPLLGNWNIFHQPIAFVIFLCAMFAENNRLPFDLPEAEPELGAGYHAEYSGLKFAMFMLGEYVAMILMSSLCVTLFFGGWSGPGVGLSGASTVTSWLPGLIGVAWFMVKVLLVLCFYMWVRWTLPRFRYDQLMRLGWKMLVPLGLANLFVTGVIVSL
jgi:NADH-quinone oxidoreductase subunit H